MDKEWRKCSKDELVIACEKLQNKLIKYESRLSAMVEAYKNLIDEKKMLEDRITSLSRPSNSPCKTLLDVPPTKVSLEDPLGVSSLSPHTPRPTSSKLKVESAININNKRRLDENPINAHDKILNWQNKNTKENQTNFKIPKIVHNVKNSPGIAGMPLQPMLNLEQIRPHIFQHDPLPVFPNTNSQEQPDLRANLNNLIDRGLGHQHQYHANNVVQDTQQNYHFDKKETNCGQISIQNDSNHSNHHNGNTSKKKHYSGLCRNFQTGLCKRGINCKFEHKKQETKSNSSDDQVIGQIKKRLGLCRNFQTGLCKRGINCKFEHKKQETKSNSSDDQVIRQDNYGKYQKNLRRGVSINDPIQGLFEKLKCVIDRKDYSAILNLVQSIEEKIKVDENKGKVNNEDIYQLSKSIEDVILMIFGDGNRENMQQGAELSLQLISTKQNLKCVTTEDLLYVRKIHFKIQDFIRKAATGVVFGDD